MIVWCGRCDTNPVVIGPDNEPLALSWFGMAAGRPWCYLCILWAIMQWPNIGTLVAEPVHRRAMRDADTCSMGPSEEPCPHGVRRSRFCMKCDDERFFARFR